MPFAGKCTYGRGFGGPKDIHIFDVCTTTAPYLRWRGNSTKSVCDGSKWKGVKKMYYSDYDCSEINEIVEEDFEEVYCYHERFECDYFEFVEWRPSDDKPGTQCGPATQSIQSDYNRKIVSTLNHIGKCMQFDTGIGVWSTTITINSCDSGVMKKRLHQRTWHNPSCEGSPAEEIDIDDDGEWDYPDQDGICSKFIRCSTMDVVGVTYNSANSTHTKFAMLCVFIMIIQQIFCLF